MKWIKFEVDGSLLFAISLMVVPLSLLGLLVYSDIEKNEQNKNLRTEQTTKRQTAKQIKNQTFINENEGLIKIMENHMLNGYMWSVVEGAKNKKRNWAKNLSHGIVNEYWFIIQENENLLLNELKKE